MRRPRLTYANVISTLCLFLVLGGSAWAAKTRLGTESVGTPQLKNGAVTGAKVKKHSLTGADIKSSTLGTVPKAASAATATNATHATSADDATHADSATDAVHATAADTATTAGDATTLDGFGAAAFFPATGIQRIDAELADESSERTIFAADGLTLVSFCAEPAVPDEVIFNVGAISTAPGARADAGFVEREGASQEAVIEETGLGSTESGVWSTRGVKGGGSSGSQSVGSLVYTDAQRTIAFTLESRVANNGNCEISGTATVSG